MGQETRLRDLEGPRCGRDPVCEQSSAPKVHGGGRPRYTCSAQGRGHPAMPLWLRVAPGRVTLLPSARHHGGCIVPTQLKP